MKNELFEVTVGRGEDIKAVITDFILEHQWKNVYITGAVGSVIDMVFTAPIQNHLPLRCGKTPVSGAAEIISMCGEVMPIECMDPDLEDIYPDKDSPLFVHIHAACATAGGHVFGGGLSGGRAFRSLRVFMVPLDGDRDE
ncbi:PPC domain-containing DNA-binding protein [Lachnospiraceae bacterium 54-53]